MVEKAKEGDRFIKSDSKKTYIVTKVVIKGDWVILKEEGGDHQILTSQESLKTWINMKRDGGALKLKKSVSDLGAGGWRLNLGRDVPRPDDGGIGGGGELHNIFSSLGRIWWKR